MGDHLSWPARYRGARAADPGLEEDESPPFPSAASRHAEKKSPLLGLAPGGGCLAAGIAAGAGGLLHHLFTLTVTSELHVELSDAQAVVFCGPIRERALKEAPTRGLPGTVLYGARTFLRRLSATFSGRSRPPAIARPFRYPSP